MKKLFLFVLPALLLFTAGCKDKNQPEDLPQTLSVNPELITCPDAGGDYTIEVNSPNGAWSATTNESWIRVTPTSGEKGTAEVRIKISPNKESAESKGVITFTSGEETVEFPITRAAKAAPYLRIVSDLELNTPKEGGSYTVQVESNIKWSASSNTGWAKVNKGVSVNNDNITVTVSPATTPEETTATITIAPYGEGEAAGTQQVTITRGSTEATSLSVDPTEITAPENGGSFTVNVSSNAKWRVYKTWDMDWLTLSGSQDGDGNGSFSFSIEEATSMDAVSGILTIEEDRSDNYKPVVTQVAVSRKGKAAADLTVAPIAINAPAEGGHFPVAVKSNYSWTATTSGNFFSLSSTSGDGYSTIVVSVSPASDINEATGFIIITTSFGNESARINIKREAAAPIAPEPTGEPASMYAAKPFSINISGDNVYFSQGNLQYQASTNTWRFALRQWSVIGEYNQYISDTYPGWIDLFGYGTGLHPTWSYIDAWRYPAFTDWGRNAICNGGNVNNQWRTLTEFEMRYILGIRDKWDELRGYGTVNDVPGFILLPDDWHLPASLTFKADDDGSTAKYSDNVYSGEQWQKMEAAGAVFLPAAGSRTGTVVYNLTNGRRGFYWAAPNQPDEESSTGVDMFAFWEGFNYRVSKDYHPESGLSVRLVRNAN